MKILSIDIGGSSIKYTIIDVVRGDPNILASTNKINLKGNNFKEIKTNVFDIIEKNVSISDLKIEHIAISTTGSVDTKMKVISAGHFEGYKDICWREIIICKFPVVKSVYVANDGRASTWAEYKSNKISSQSHIHVVVGTGVGGGLVYNDELLLGESGQAGYIGHIKVTEQETITCSCKNKGCLETVASLRGIEEFYRISSSNKVNFVDIVEKAKNMEKHALEAIEKGGYWLGVGIGNCMNIVNPGVISVGGGVVDASIEVNRSIGQDLYFEALIEGVKYSSHRRVFASGNLRRANYGNDGGLVGAALLAYKKLKT